MATADDDDEVCLAPETLLALQQFLAERDSQQDLTRDVALRDGVPEDWELSQFWYDSKTAEFLASTAARVSKNGRIACVSTPTLFRAMMNAGYPRDKCTVFEVDRRFECYGSQFVFYDLNHPQSVPKDQLHSFDFVCIDPPFLNRDTVQAMLQTAALLARTSSTPMLILTGAMLEQDILDVSNGALQRQEFVPRHEGSRLRNDFASFANFPLQQL